MKISKNHEEMIINFGALGYSGNKIANILGLNPNDVILEAKNPNSELSKLLRKGRDMADYVIDLKLFEMAKSGDIKALEKLELRKRTQNYEKNN